MNLITKFKTQKFTLVEYLTAVIYGRSATNHHYERISNELDLTDDQVEAVIAIISEIDTTALHEALILLATQPDFYHDLQTSELIQETITTLIVEALTPEVAINYAIELTKQNTHRIQTESN